MSERMSAVQDRTPARRRAPGQDARAGAALTVAAAQQPRARAGDARCLEAAPVCGRHPHASLPWLAVLLVATLAGCAVGPDYVAPELDAPERWQSDAGREATPDLTGWWHVLADPTLDELVELALANNLDVAKALARLREVRARRLSVRGELAPAMDARAGYSRQRTSQAIGSFDNGDTDPGNDGQAVGFSPERDIYSTGFDASWELDIFGGRRRALEQAGAEAGAAGADLAEVRASLVAELVTNYVEMRSLEQRIEIARANVAVQADTRDLAEARYRAGLTGELELQQATYSLADTRSRIPDLERSLVEARNRIAVLTGAAPGERDELLGRGTGEVPVAPAEVAVGLPVDLLRRRPDVARAERNLAAATAAVGVATADLYPKLSLTGSFGFSAVDLADIGSAASRTFDLGPSLRWRVLDFGRIRNEIAARSAAVAPALADYEAPVLAALEETENAVAAWSREQAKREHLAEGAAAARLAEQLATTQYVSGVVDFQQVLEAQRALRGFEDSLAASEATVTTRLVAVYKALGGGFAPEPALGEGANR